MTFLTIGKSGHVLQEQAEVAQPAEKGRQMGLDRLFVYPLSLIAAGSTLATTIFDVNWGALVGSLGAAGMAAAGGYLAFRSNKTKADQADRSAKIKDYEDEKQARIRLEAAEAKARLRLMRDEAAARLQIQREQEAANKESLQAKVQSLEAELKEKRKQWHDQYDHQTGMLDKVRADLWLAQLQIARMEGQLGVTDRVHSEAINANADNIIAVAQSTGTALPAPTPHVEPIASGSGDDFEPFLPRFPDNHGPDGPPDSRINPNNPR